MSYGLGVDLGTTFTAAAVDNGSGPTMLGLGNRSLQIPSVLFLTDEGFVVGEAAELRGSVEPGRVVREFKRRIGDHVPILVGGSPFSAELLTARLLQWVITLSTERMGEAPARLVLTHPANWGPFKLDVFASMMALADVRDAQRVPEPVAAAAQYASRARVEVGDKLAVYDFGGGTFDVCIVERTEHSFAVLGTEGVEHLGGTDLDHALFREVLVGLRDRLGDLDPEDPAATVGLSRLRRDCVVAKEALSTDVVTFVPVSLPGLDTTVRVTRSEFETLIRPTLDETVAAVRRGLRAASVEPSDLSAIVLIGGSSRIPIVGEMLQRHFDIQPALDTHPKHDVALGAARLSGPPEPPNRSPASRSRSARRKSAAATGSAAVPANRDGATFGPRVWPRLLIVAGVAGAIAAVAIATFVIRAGDAGVPRDVSPSVDPVSASSSPAPTDSTSNNASTEAATAAVPPPVVVPQARQPLPADELLLTRDGNENWDIWRMTIDGAATRQLTLGAGSDTRSVLSADRRSVIYLHEKASALPDSKDSPTGPKPDVDGLRVMAVDGSGDRRLFSTGPSSKLDLERTSWSPDGKMIASRSRVRGKPDQLVVLSVDGSSRRIVAEAALLSDPTFTQDGRSVTYWASTRTDVDGGTLMIVPADGRTRPVEFLPGKPGQDADPAWSPDGTKLAFRRDDKDGYDVWVVNRDGTRLRRLTSARGADQDPTWSPDGRRIAFRSERQGEPDIFVMDADGTDEKLVVHHRDADGGPAWSRR